MASTPTDIIHGADVLYVSAASISPKVVSENSYGKDFTIDLIKNDDSSTKFMDDAISDVREMQRRLERISLPTEISIVENEVSASSIQDKDNENATDVNIDDEIVRRRFFCEPWSILRGYLERSKLSCDTGIDECGTKTKEHRNLAVLPHTKFPLYGFCPSRDEYVVVKCKLCGTAVKPVAHRAHMHSRHNMGLKSPEPMTPITSVISPTFPSSHLDDSTIQPNLPLESNPEYVSMSDHVFETKPVTLEKGLPKDTKRTNSRLKAPTIDPMLPSMDAVRPASDYVVVAPHSTDRPLKLTFRRARPNSNSKLATTSSQLNSKKTMDTRRPSASMVLSSSSDRVIEHQMHQQKFEDVKSHISDYFLIAKSKDTKPPDPWLHQMAPSTSSSVSESWNSVDIKPNLKPPISTSTPSVTIQNHVYEHPKPLASSRFAQWPSVHVQLPSAIKLDYGDHACYLLSSDMYNSQRWSTHRRSTQSIRQACRKLFITDDSDNGNHDSTSAVFPNGSVKRPRINDISLTTNRTSNNIGQNRHGHKTQMTVLPNAGANNRMVRLTNSGKHGNNGHVTPLILPANDKIDTCSMDDHIAKSGGGTSTANKTYTKVNINQLKASVVESGTPQVALDLGSLMWNGGSSYQSNPSHAECGNMAKQIICQKRMAPKRSSSSISPSFVTGYVGPEVAVTGKRPRLHPVVHANGTAGVVEIDDTNFDVTTIKTAPSPSLNHIQAKHQLAKALHQTHISNNINRKPSSIHQVTPYVISPSQTPQPSQNQSQQQQVVLVSMNGPAVLTGWQKLNANAAIGDQCQPHQTTGFFQNGLTASTAIPLGTTSAHGAARIIRPKMVAASGTVPVIVTHTDQHPRHQIYRPVNSFPTQRFSSNVRISRSIGNVRALKQPQTARSYRRPNAVDDVAMYPNVQQQPVVQFRAVQAQQQHQLNAGNAGLLRHAATSSAPILAGPIVLNVATIARSQSNVSISSSSSAVGGQSSSAIPTNANLPLNVLAATNTAYPTASTTVSGIYSM